ncbi:phosphoenolpyruvate--protein phosphotransferase [Phenylobacterium sp.]|uniref:phosphoenolpyruvate--protein phosphotransferase n=1 Tax=Phenylobacterium sp. TaxID=1871053 RepID=UPI0028112D44|nr:phosphoenolpyruvate--protein phosphotransferase [Phenylobacterium sp.]
MKAAKSASPVAEVLVLDAPMNGWAAPLDEAPDEVFAGRMLGDGVAIDPTAEELCAPCDGVVTALPASRHAVTVRADNGAEILMHVGLETVGLAGQGFTAHVREGERVRRGQRLLTFDLDVLAGRARSLITPVVVMNATIASRVTGCAVRQGQPLMEVHGQAGGQPCAVASELLEAEASIALPHGLHARPAARLAACAQSFDAEVQLEAAGGRRANLRSAVSVLALGVGHGEKVRLIAGGPDAAAVLGALKSLLADLALEEAAHVRPEPTPSPRPAATDAPGTLRGVTAAPGLAIGVAVRLAAPEPAVIETSRGAKAERQVLAEALARVAWRLRDQASGGGTSRRDILAAHQAFLADPELRAEAERQIEQGLSAGAAWRAATRAMAETLRRLGDPLFAERADDLLDLERQVLIAISGEELAGPRLPAGAVVIADELLPSQLIALEGAPVAGFCTARGGATSHVAILAAAMGAPALAAMGPELLRVPDGTPVILDADAGVLKVAPDGAALAAAQGQLASLETRRRADRQAAAEPARLADGVPIEVLANLGAAGEAAGALIQGAEGCGLFRTEFLFLDRQDAPSEDEQAAVYESVAAALQGRPLTIRTLDAGGDKPLAFAPAPHEPNPALGLRGVRASLRQPELLSAQLRAILRVAAPGERRILLPMVCDLSDLRAVRAALDAAVADLKPAHRPKLGVMIETPASALLADQLAAEADFLSVGTNDLSQYVLAIDREHPELAARLDALHPAVLRLVARAAEAGRTLGKPVGVCGGLASEPLAAPLLVGLGAGSLSAAPAAVPAVKARLRGWTLAQTQALAHAALELTSADEVRALLRQDPGAST